MAGSVWLTCRLYLAGGRMDEDIVAALELIGAITGVESQKIELL
jgi:hypothetical protein